MRSQKDFGNEGNYDATTSGNIVNQVQRAYNGLGQMTTEWQSHSGAVNTGSSPKVQYAYSEMPSGANHSRPVSMTYPNGRVIDFNYGVALDDAIGRLSALKDGATTLESYDYLGLGTVVKRGHAQSGVDLTFIKASGESNGDAGDQYTGLDRFGRIVDQRWRTSSVEKDRYQYTYDRNGNRTSETNALSSSFNEAYSYDNLNQLTGFNRNSGARTQSWDYDALGNWESVTTNASTQTRTHNRQNEITAVSGATTPVFDAAGNMTTDETGKQYVYDAWNRLVTVKNSGGTTIASYAYDPLTRRISETASSVTTDLYYSVQWQVVEERVSGNATKSYVWSPVYVDAMVARDRDTDANGSLDERLYVMHDANFNVTGLVNTSGTVVERYTYDPFGAVTVHDGSWTVTSTAYVWQYLHQGGRLSGQSGLYSFRNREYSPMLGRWVTMDPINYLSGTSNMFEYNANSPALFTDPLGYITKGEFVSGDVGDYSDFLKKVLELASGVNAINGRVSIDDFIHSWGGKVYTDKIPVSSNPKLGAPKPRYIFTCKCGLLDFRHVFTMMGIALHLSSKTSVTQGITHEINSEHQSRFSAEDITSNAIGAYIGELLQNRQGKPALSPFQLRDTIKKVVDKCMPLDWSKLTAKQQKIITKYYSYVPSAYGPPNQSANAGSPLDLYKMPREEGCLLCGNDNEFPFKLDKVTVKGQVYYAQIVGEL